MFNNRPVIGIMPLYDKEKDSFWMHPGYMKGLQKQGAITLMMPMTNDVHDLNYFLKECDGFLIPGGQDVDPSSYKANKSEKCGETCIGRDLMDQYIIKKCYEMDKPLLGICRGIQIMNVTFGGSLFQDIESEYNSNVKHSMVKPYNRVQHRVDISGPLKDLIGETNIGVNSYHHQAVKDLAPIFDVMATSEDGLVEGIYIKDKKFIWGIQWHPELSYITFDESEKIFRAFIKACKK